MNEGGPYTYSALQFHFHSHSEHLINGSYYDLEMHIVHYNAEIDKAYAIIGVMFQQNGVKNDFLEEVQSGSPTSLTKLFGDRTELTKF